MWMTVLLVQTTWKKLHTYKRHLTILIDKAQMTIIKWRSNSIDLKAKFPEGLLEKDEVKLVSAPSACFKAL